eukprot:s1668_g6.t1
MLQVTVALPSGCCEKFSIPQSSRVGDLRVLAQKSFQRGFLRLVAEDHRALDPAVSLEAAGLEDGGHLTAIVLEAKLAATSQAFALFCSGGDRVVTWGKPNSGGDSSEVRNQLKGVQQLQATGLAFAAILADGSVLSWGDPNSGGDSSEVQDQLKGVQQLQATHRAFAAILADGSVVTWGDPYYGGGRYGVKDQLKGVQQLQATGLAFAAILADGSIVSWGDPNYGGDSPADSIAPIWSALSPAERADIFRYLVLYDQGGYFAELSVSCEKPIADYQVPQDAKMLVGYEFGHRWSEVQRLEVNFARTEQFANYFLASAPSNPVLRRVLEMVRERFSWKIQSTDLTGAAALSDAVHEFLEVSTPDAIAKENNVRKTLGESETLETENPPNVHFLSYESEHLYGEGEWKVWLLAAGRVNSAPQVAADDPKEAAELLVSRHG